MSFSFAYNCNVWSVVPSHDDGGARCTSNVKWPFIGWVIKKKHTKLSGTSFLPMKNRKSETVTCIHTGNPFSMRPNVNVRWLCHSGDATKKIVDGDPKNSGIRKKENKNCIGRETNPGHPRGRREFYHWTTDASHFLEDLCWYEWRSSCQG